MLSNTLSFTYLGEEGSVTKDFTRYDEYQNRTVYIGQNHTLTSRNTLSFYRSFPKQQGNFKGVGKTTFKISEDIVVPGNDGVTEITSPAIIEVNFSLPLGITDVQVENLRLLVASILTDESLMVSLNKQLQI